MTVKLTIKQLLQLVLILMMGISIGACSKTTWKEEVQLSDGRIIVVERETLHEGGGDEWAHNRSLSKPKERHVLFSHPDGSGQMVEWRSTKLDSRTWPEKPLILDTEANQPVIFSVMSISVGCEKYFKYAYRKGVWNEEALPGRFETRPSNLYLRDGTDMPKFVSLAEKRKENSSIDFRPSLKQVGPDLNVCG